VPSAYFNRNPSFTNPAGIDVQLVPANLRVWPGRVTPGINRGYKSLNTEGKMTEVTAACAPTIYRGGLFPAELRGDAFICEPSGNLIKRISLSESGGALIGRNAYEGTEFLTSTDERFRPVTLANGPDGALYIVDMYRGIIQHRIYVTSYLRKQIESRDLDKGLHGGRIYRIVPENAPSAAERFAALPHLATADTAGLVAALASANGWTRDTAQRLLVEKRDPAATAALKTVAGTAQEPLARLHALWTLEGTAALDVAILEKCLGDSDPRVVAAAVRLSEKFLANDAALQAKVIALLAPLPAPAVRLQLALTLGGVRTPEATAALHTLLRDAGDQPYIVDAIVSGLAGREMDFIEKVATETAPESKAATRAIVLAASCVFKAGEAASIQRLDNFINAVRHPLWARLAALDGLERYIPHNKERKLLMASLPVEPKALQAVAARKANDPAGGRADELLAHLKWPGKPGTTTAAIALTPEQQALFNEGRTNFANICAVCHQPNGQGQSGLAPALVNSRWVQGDPRALARIVLQGRATENLIMPSLKGLDDRMLASILTYIRQSWGHNSPPIGPEVIAQARKETAGREEPWSETELNELFPEAPAK
jgi:mono/diheme cytochrome c family protein